MIHLFTPLLFAALLVGVVVAAVFNQRVHHSVTRVSLALFGWFLERDHPRRERALERMRATHIAQTHGAFASRSLLFSFCLGLAAAIVLVYLVGFLVFGLLGVAPLEIVVALRDAFVPASPDELDARVFPSLFVIFSDMESISQLTPFGVFVFFSLACLFVGLPLAGIGYAARWVHLDQMAAARANRIDTTLPRTVAFIYALSRSGMPFPKVLETLAANRQVYGAAAAEFAVAVRDTETFGTDIITALEDTATRTPSASLEEFTENLASVLGSGRALSTFLHEQYERYQDEIAAQQQTYLELLETFAEIYVTVLVAGPLFFITVLVVIGLVIADTLPIIQFITYLGIPLASVAFIIYIDSITGSLRATGWQGNLTVDSETERVVSTGQASEQAVADGGAIASTDRQTRNETMLRAYDRLAPIRSVVENPWEHILQNPKASLYLTVPLALAWIAFTFDSTVVTTYLDTGRVTLAGALDAIDEPLVQGGLVVIGVLSLIYELHKRTYRDIEHATPDFLDRLASVNEAGLTVVASLKRVSQTDLGTLGTELERANRDVQWGADVATALRRMANRTNAPMLIRSVALVTNAMGASGDISPVLRIAANETEDARTLREERRQQMLTYLVVIYVSFFVFLGIIVALTVSFIPAIESASSSAAFTGDSPVSTGIFGGLSDVNTGAYTLLFFHVSVVQGLFSGLIAGQLGEGRVADGLKHATVLVFITYVVFQVL